MLRVTDTATGAAVTDVSANGEPTVCVEMPLHVECRLDGAPYTSPGLHAIELSAPGYAALSLEVEVKASAPGTCCSCGYSPTRVDVALTPSLGSD